MADDIDTPAAPQSNPRLSLLRGLLVVLGLLAIAPLVLIGGSVAFATGVSAARPPDPFERGGLFCCDRPDTWAQVAEYATFTAAVVAGVALLLVLARALVSRRRLRWRALRVPVGAAAGTMLLIGALLLLRIDEAVTPPDCEGFVVDRKVFRDEVNGSKAHRVMVLGVRDCGVVLGKSIREYRALLGKPDFTEPDGSPGGTGTAFYGLLEVRAVRGRVVETVLQPPGDGFD